jgi:Lon protease-like protein
LHIFEPRYKALIRECLERGLEFGINYFYDGHMQTVGCAAKVVEITTTYDDGRMDIIIEGVYRFSLLELAKSDAPYAVGEIEVLADEPLERVNKELLSSVLCNYNLVVTMVFGATAHTFSMNDFRETPSFDMAPKCGLSDEQKQQLISSSSENERLQTLDAHLRQLLPAMQRAEKIQEFIQRDGYFRAIPS